MTQPNGSVTSGVRSRRRAAPRPVPVTQTATFLTAHLRSRHLSGQRGDSYDVNEPTRHQRGAISPLEPNARQPRLPTERVRRLRGARGRAAPGAAPVTQTATFLATHLRSRHRSGHGGDY